MTLTRETPPVAPPPPRRRENRVVGAVIGTASLGAGALRRAPRPKAWMWWLLGALVVVFLLPAVNSHKFSQGVIAQGVVYGAATGLTALGLVLIYRATRIINFAYGAMGGVGATTAVSLYQGRHLPWLLCVVIGIAIGAGIGAAVELGVIRRFFTAPRLIVTVATIGLAQLLGGIQLLVPGWVGGGASASSVGSFDTFLSKSHFDIGVVLFTGNDVLLIAVIPVVIFALSYFLLRTDAGRAVRAVADNGDRALLLGIPIRTLSTIVWVIAGAIIALTTTLGSPTQGLTIDAGAGPALLLPALTAAVVARFESLPVAFGSGVALGILNQVLLTDVRASGTTTVAYLLVILAALLVRRGGSGRGNTDDTSWASAGTLTAIPRALRRLPEVRIAKVLGFAALAALVFGLGLTAEPGRLETYTFTLIYGMVAVSLVVLTGWSGQVSLGQYAFVGVGAIVTGDIIAQWNVDLFVSLIGGALAGALVAVLIGLPALRIKGFYLAVTTLAFAVMMDSYLLNPTNFSSILPGNTARNTFDAPILWQRFQLGAIGSGRPLFFLTLGLLAIVIAFAVALRRSRPGRAMIATRDNERAARAMAVPATRLKLIGFVLAGVIAGIAGGLHVIALNSVGTHSFEPDQSLLIFAMVVIGGVSSIGGALTGVAVVEFLIQVFPKYQLEITGIGLLVILAVVPGGLGAALQRLRDWLLRPVARRHGLLDEGEPADLLAAAAKSGTPLADGEAHATAELPVVRPGEPSGAAAPTTVIDEAGADETGADAMLRCRDVQLSYGGTKILFGIDFDVYDGEMVALLGTNGAGKSTLLKAITGLAAKSHGSVRFDGQDISKPHPDKLARTGVAMMPGGRGIFPSLTVKENLRLSAWTIRRDRDEVRASTARLLALFPVLESRRDQTAGNMSGGEQQQLSLAMALMTKPKLLLIDELSLGLAPTIVAQLIEVVRQLNREGVTIVVVEQSVNVALELAERAVFLEKGQVRFSGRTSDLLDRPDVLRSVFIAGAAALDEPAAPPPVRRRRRKGEPDPEVIEAKAAAERRDRLAEAPVVLATETVALSFGGIRALRGIDLHLKKGEIVGLIGHNGAGKTTLFDCISGFLRPDSGQVLLGGNAVGHLAANSRAWVGLGRSFQEAKLYAALTVEETVSVALERHLASRDLVAAGLRLPASTDSEALVSERVTELLAMTGLTGYAERLIGQLSTGTRRIVELACVLAQEPAVLLLDEPSGGVAQKETEALGPMLRRVQQQTGCSMLVIEHDMPLLSGLCDRLVAFELGEVIAEGPPSYVLEHPQVVASYLGTDEVAVNRSGTKAPDAGGRRNGTPRKATARKVTARKTTAKNGTARPRTRATAVETTTVGTPPVEAPPTTPAATAESASPKAGADG